MSLSACPNGVCAVIVSYNPDAELLMQLLEALQPQVRGVVIVDNGSASDLHHLLTGREAVLLELGENLGVAAGFNRGIAWAGENGFELVLLLDQDSVPQEDMVARLQAALASLVGCGKKVAAVGALTCDPQTRHKSGFARFGALRFNFVSQAAGEETVPADFLISSGSLIQLTTLRQIGGMDEGLFIDLVDTEWFLRCASNGLQAYGVPAALLRHRIGNSTKQLQFGGKKIGRLHNHEPLRHYYIFRNSLLLSRRVYVNWHWVLNNSVQLLGMFVYFSLFTPPRLEHLRMMIRGLQDGIQGRTGKFKQ